MIVVGISGLYGSGKSEVLEFLKECGFVCLSLSDVIREELKTRNLSETRAMMIEVGNELRRLEGPGALAKRLLSRMRTDRNHAIDSIRHPAEVDVFRRGAFEFRLLWIEAEESVRLARIRMRDRPGDPDSLDSLREMETKERWGERVEGQNLEGVRQLADTTIVNDQDVQALRRAVQSFLEGGVYFERPAWDEYFLDIASVVASRSNCIKRKVAAVITLDRRIISTGYNGTPRGVQNCNEGGCPRCRRFAPGGTALEECLCCHAEENAITQAAYHGVSVKGGTLYTTFSPCLLCTKMIINAGISEVVYGEEYTLGDTSQQLLREASVGLRQLELRGRWEEAVQGSDVREGR